MILTRDEILAHLQASPPLIEGLIDAQVQVQPAGVDLTVREVYEFTSCGSIDFTNEERVLSDLRPVPFSPDGWARLRPGAYLIRYNEVVSVPLDVVAVGRPRSSLLRMGAFVVTAVWDPGYRGRGVSLLIVANPHGVRIKRNARVVQLLFIKLSGRTVPYEGAYMGEGLAGDISRGRECSCGEGEEGRHPSGDEKGVSGLPRRRGDKA